MPHSNRRGKLGMLKEQFIERCCRMMNKTWEELQKTHEVIPCPCEWAPCTGWILRRRDQPLPQPDKVWLDGVRIK